MVNSEWSSFKHFQRFVARQRFSIFSSSPNSSTTTKTYISWSSLLLQWSSKSLKQEDRSTWNTLIHRIRKFSWINYTSTLGNGLKKNYVLTRLRNALNLPKLGLKSVRQDILQRLASMPSYVGARKSHFLVAACLFTLNKEQTVSADELDQAVDDLEHIMALHSTEEDTEVAKTKAKARVHDHYMDDWTLIYEKPGIAIWSRPVPGKSYYQYKVHGSYTDIPARAFYFVQVDLPFRKQWDVTTHELEMVHRDEQTGTEIVHWICNFPRPMYKREYVYARRYAVNNEKNCLVILSRSIDYPGLPQSNKYVRVEDYCSRMVIKPHKSFDKNGFDYIMTYYDDTKTNMPNKAYNYMVAKGLPDFLNQLHTIAKGLMVNHNNEWKYLTDKEETEQSTTM